MDVQFRWNTWNLEHATKHGVSVDEAEAIVRCARPPYPERRGEAKWLVAGRGQAGRFIQVIYIVDPDDTVFVIHARPLTDAEKRRYRRRIK